MNSRSLTWIVFTGFVIIEFTIFSSVASAQGAGAGTARDSGLSFFRMASARDPRPIIIHEGVPGHYFQLSLSWANEDSIRRHYIDSGPIEGWGFRLRDFHDYIVKNGNVPIALLRWEYLGLRDEVEGLWGE